MNDEPIDFDDMVTQTLASIEEERARAHADLDLQLRRLEARNAARLQQAKRDGFLLPSHVSLSSVETANADRAEQSHAKINEIYDEVLAAQKLSFEAMERDLEGAEVH